MPWLVAGANGLTRLETLLLRGPIPALFVHLPPCSLWNLPPLSPFPQFPPTGKQAQSLFFMMSFSASRLMHI